MERISELITKKKIEENNKIKDILILKNKNIILLYANKLDIYKYSLLKYLEMYPFPKQSPIIINEVYEIKTKKSFIIIAITTNTNDIYFYKIQNKSFKLLQIIQGNILCKLNDDKKFIKFFKIKSNCYSYSIYKNGKNLKYEKIKDNEIAFKSYFEKYKKISFNQDSNDPILDNIKTYNEYGDYSRIFSLKSYRLEMQKYESDIEIIKLLKLSENKIIIITKEDNKQTWNYSTKEKKVEYNWWKNVNFNCNFFIYSIILFDIKSEEKNILFTKDILYEVEEPYHTLLKIFVHSVDVNVINDNFLYFNICNEKHESPNDRITEFINDLIIYNIDKKAFVKYNILFKDFNDLLEIKNLNNILCYKMNTYFYLILGYDLYEFKVIKDGIVKLFFCRLDENNNNNNVKYHFKFQDGTFYILTSNHFYIFKLKN